MTDTTIWYDGHNNYKKCSITKHDEISHFHTEIQDVELMGTSNIFEIFNNHLSQRQTKTVEVCFSGGVDSEIAILGCLHNKIPVRALTLRIYSSNLLLNVIDVHYSEKFCREFDVEQKFIDIDVNKFYDNGDYIELLRPYKITTFVTALHFWTLSQATGYPVMGGDYSWPWVIKPIVSPHSHGYMLYYQYMKDNGIHGLGSMLGHSLDSNLTFIKAHLAVFNQEKHDPSDGLKLPMLKRDIAHYLGFTTIQPRIKSYGVEMIHHRPYYEHLTDLFGETKSTISWGNSISELLGDNPGFNDTRG